MCVFFLQPAPKYLKYLMPCLQLLSAPDHKKFNWCLSVNGNKSNKSICYFYCDGGGLSVAAGLCWAKGTLELLLDRSHIFMVILPTVIVESGERNPSPFYIESNKNINGITRNGLEMFILPQNRGRNVPGEFQGSLYACASSLRWICTPTGSFDSKPKAIQFSSIRQHRGSIFPICSTKAGFNAQLKGDRQKKLLMGLKQKNGGEGKVVIGRMGTICLDGQSDAFV